jgi:hypothetical protein
MSPLKSILLLGHGELGHSILHSLLAQKPASTTLTLLLRPSTLTSSSPSKALELSHLKSKGIIFLPADIVSLPLETLTPLFTPYTLIISCLGFASPSVGLQLKITRAVLAAHVPWYIPWQFGIDYDLVGRGSAQPVWDEQLDVRDLLRSQTSTKWTIISTGLFTSFLFEPSFGVINVNTEGEVEVRALGEWENRITVTTPGDIGWVTAEVVFSGGEGGSEILYTAGDTISYSRLVGVVEEVLGREVRKVVWSVEELERELENDPEHNMKRYRVAFAKGKGVSWEVEKTINRKRGIKVVDVKEFVERNLERIRKGEESSEKWK